MRRLLAITVLAFVVLVAGGAAADTFTLTVTSQTNSTITFSYPAQTGFGYLYSANGVVVSRTNNPSVTSVKFSKNTANSYEVASIVKGTTGTYQPATPPPPPPTGALTQTIVQGSTVSGTVSWRAVYTVNGTASDPGSVRFSVDSNVVLTETDIPFGDTAGFWNSTTVANGSHTFRVEAVNASNAVIATSSVTATVSNGTTPPPPPPSGSFPNDTNTGTPAGLTLHACASTITTSGTYDLCQFNGSVSVRANNVTITRSRINGQLDTSTGVSGTVVQDTTVACGCLSQGANDTPVGIFANNVRLTRINEFGSGHGVAVESNVIIEDSYIHGLGGTTQAHKDGLYVGDGHTVTVRHNNIACDAGDGCTAAIGILTDFSDVYDWTIDNNLLNDTGSYCLYGNGGPTKPFTSHDIRVTNNHFGRKFYANCGFYGPVTYFNINAPGMVWSGNVWDDTGQLVPPAN